MTKARVVHVTNCACMDVTFDPACRVLNPDLAIFHQTVDLRIKPPAVRPKPVVQQGGWANPLLAD